MFFPGATQEPESPTHIHSGPQEGTKSLRIWREEGKSCLRSPYPCPLFHRLLRLQPPPWGRQRQGRWQRGLRWRRQGLVGGSASLVPLRLLLQLVEVAAGAAPHLAAAPRAALWPHRSGYVVTAAPLPLPKGKNQRVSRVSGAKGPEIMGADPMLLQMRKLGLQEASGQGPRASPWLSWDSKAAPRPWPQAPTPWHPALSIWLPLIIRPDLS